MNKIRTPLRLLLIGALLSTCAVGILAGSEAGKFSIRKQKEEVVLYTIFRGGYDKTGMAVGKLYALAGQKGVAPRGPACYVYLNNPKMVTSEHWLTEIRIPVGKEALKLAGTLGEFTDVKQLPAMDVAVATKPQGLVDPGPIYDSLYAWIEKQGYRAADSAYEVFLSNTMAGDYAQMKSEIVLPVIKLASQ